MLRIDHVVYAVGDLDEAAERFRREYGLDSTPGGRHPGWGTANQIVPLGESYLELIAAVDLTAASASAFGRSVIDRAAGGGWLAICLEADDLDAVGARLDLEVTDGRRELPDGTEIAWRSAGLEDPRREPWMPFFIAWDGPRDRHPGRARAGHGVQVHDIARVGVGGDGARLREWLGGDDIPIRVIDTEPGVRAVALSTTGGELLVV